MNINAVGSNIGSGNNSMISAGNSRRLAGVEKTEQEIEKNNYSKPISVELSDEARLLSENEITKVSNNHKRGGVTGVREVWENDASSLKYNQRFGPAGNYDPLYLMQLYDSETYAKFEELNCMSDYGNQKYGYSLEDIENAQKERDQICSEWYINRGIPLEQQLAAQHSMGRDNSIIDKLEDKYSDSHELSINVYYTEGQDEHAARLNQFSGTSLWRYSTKFNMLLTSDMLKKLLGTSEKEKEDVLNRIDSVVNNMKEAEKSYEGDKVFLRFGVKFHTNGDISYHANYKDCEDSYGIHADSADELLEKLM